MVAKYNVSMNIINATNIPIHTFIREGQLLRLRRMWLFSGRLALGCVDTPTIASFSFRTEK